MTVSDLKSQPKHRLQMLTDTTKHESTSVPVWCRFHKLLMHPSSFSPASDFSILGDYHWERLCNSNKQLPLLFPSARCVEARAVRASVMLICEDRLEQTSPAVQSVPFPPGALSILFPRGGGGVSDNWRLYTAFLSLTQLRLDFCSTKGSIWR